MSVCLPPHVQRKLACNSQPNELIFTKLTMLRLLIFLVVLYLKLLLKKTNRLIKHKPSLVKVGNLFEFKNKI